MDFPYVKEALTKLFSKPSTNPYPFAPAPAKPNYRGRIVFHPDKCINCNMCERVCAGQAISHTSEPCEGGEMVTRQFYLGSCTFCAHCVAFCNHGAIEMSDDYHMVADYYHAPSFEEGEEALIVTGKVFKKAPVKKAPPAAPKAEVKAAVADAKADVKEAVKEAKAEVKEAVKEAVAEAKADVKAAAAAAAAPVVEAVKEAQADVKEAVERAVVPQPRDDGKPVQDPAKCVYCTLCAKNCPMEALTVDRKAKTWELNEEACISCGTCASACPKDAIIM
ncbi:MAG: 4Fe-4S binding protein [Oscillospiraceae bacterium]|nr:4Fe-4S binding protein [Oscillospiraceae bacterium]